jgi:hypothetical protein
MFSANECSAAQAGGQGFVFGFRVPRDYFISKGWGDTSDVRPCTAHSWVAFAVKALALHTLLLSSQSPVVAAPAVSTA